MSVHAQPIDIGVLMALAYGQFVVELRAYLALEGFDDLGRSDGYVFRALDLAPMTTSELAERLRITKQGAAQIVADMQRRGYVERQPHPDDRRAQRLRLTVRGEAALTAARRFHRADERRLRREHGGPAIDAFRALLTAIAGDGQPLDPELRGLYV